MSQLVTLRLAYWRQVITDTPCPEPLCPGQAEGHACVPYTQVVHQSRLRAATQAKQPMVDADAAGQ